MDQFFAQPGVRHRRTRDWPDGGQRHWFKVDAAMTPQEIRALLELAPVGAYVRCFDREYDSPSDPGAWVALQRYPTLWTATFENHGWTSSSVPIDFEDAVLLVWDCRDFDYSKFLGVRNESELMAHSGLSVELPQRFDGHPESKPARHIKDRVASIRQRLDSTSSEAGVC
jgi:hypothetical protein